MKYKATIAATLFASLAPVGLVSCGSENHQKKSTEAHDATFNIVGGDEVLSSDPIAKHSVVFGDAAGNIGCSGVIVGPHQVLSAAHCWGDNFWEGVHVVFATRAADARFQLAGTNTRRVVKAVRHEGYEAVFSDPKMPPFDIALVTFEGTLPLGYEPAAIFNTSLEIPNGTEVILAGYGSNGESESGPRMLRTVTSVIGSQNLRKKEFYFGPTPGRGPCGGDSGGPAFVKHAGTLYLIATTSRGTPDSDTCLDGKALYTDVRFFQEWAEARGNFKMKVVSADTF